MTSPHVLAESAVLEAVDSLTPHPQNPRQGDVGAIAESIRANGFYAPIVAQTSTRHVLVGNHRLLAARTLGMAEVPVVWVDVDDERAVRILLADNRASDLGAYDDQALAALLTDLAQATDGALAGTGYDPSDLDALLRTLAGPVDPTEEWVGMGAYEQPDLGSKFRTTVHFATDEDADAFFELLDRPRRSSFWWPVGDGHVGSSTEAEYVLSDGSDATT